MNTLDMPYLFRLISLLGLGETELLKAVISGFTPMQPGAVVGTWRKRAGYAAPESAAMVWGLFEAADFKCTAPGCSSRHRLTLDHINRNTSDSSAQNLKVLCHNCNRQRVGKQITKDLSAKVVMAIFDHIDAAGSFPSNIEIAKRLGIATSRLSGTIYFIRVMRSLYARRNAFPLQGI